MSSPLQDFQSKHNERWKVLQDIPAWEVESVLNWLHNVFVYIDTTGIYQSEKFNYGVVRSIETENRLLLSDDLHIESGTWADMLHSLRLLLAKGEFGPVVLLIECTVKYVRDSSGGVLFHKNIYSSDDILIRLELSLERGSKWKIVFEKDSEVGLVERVDPKITQIAQELKINHLTKAWNEAFSTTPNPKAAIENAQLAVEQIASENGLTKAKTSVYGKLIGEIRDNQGKYISVASESYELADQITHDPKDKLSTNERYSNWFWTGLDLIQKTNPMRHASDMTKDFTLSPEAGKQAVLIATILCQIISQGYFKKLPKA